MFQRWARYWLGNSPQTEKINKNNFLFSNAPTLSNDFVHAGVYFVCHETKDRENNKSSKKAGATVNQWNQHGISVRVKEKKLMADLKLWVFNTDLISQSTG